MKISAKDWGYIIALNIIGFGKDDYYSKVDNIMDWIESYPDTVGIITTKAGGVVVGFLMWHVSKGAIRTERRAVDTKYKGLGLGVKLTKKVIQKGVAMGLPYKTYAANYNLASINSSIKCGCRISNIGEDFTSLTTEKRKC